MNTKIRHLGLGIVACYLALFAMLNYIQVYAADDLNEHPNNSRGVLLRFNGPRGQILAADGEVLARSVDAPAGSTFSRQREYPTGDLFGHITGYYSFNFAATGAELQFQDDLSGQRVAQSNRSLSLLFGEDESVNDVVLNLRSDIQKLAADALGDRNGAVVALDPRDGSVLALWGFPSYDPNPVSSQSATEATTARDALLADPNKPMNGKPWQEIYFPGSTFKLVTGSVGLQTDTITMDTPSYPSQSAYDPPDGQPISNFGGSSCGGTLRDAIRVSCNWIFSEIAAEQVGNAAFTEGVNAWGFNERVPIDLPGAAASAFGNGIGTSKAFMGQAAIGQFSTQTSPLHMALITAGIANDGKVMTPRILREVRNEDGSIDRTSKPSLWKTPLSEDNARAMQEAMINVVERGTGTAARISGYEVGGKTGTAQVDPTSNAGVIAWFTAFGGVPGAPPSVVVTVMVENQVGNSEATGGQIAAPIARDVMAKILDVQSRDQ